LLLLYVQNLNHLNFVFSDYFVQILLNRSKNQLGDLYGPKGLKHVRATRAFLPLLSRLYMVYYVVYRVINYLQISYQNIICFYTNPIFGGICPLWSLWLCLWLGEKFKLEQRICLKLWNKSHNKW